MSVYLRMVSNRVPQLQADNNQKKVLNKQESMEDRPGINNSA